jgi:SET domain
MGLHEALHVKSFTKYGFHCHGLFVKVGSRITKGEDVWWFDKHCDSLRIYTKDQILNAPTNSMTVSEINSSVGKSSKTMSDHDEEIIPNPKNALETYSYMIDDDCFASTPDPNEDLSFYINHSCMPNVGFCGDDKLIALCDIESGEQVLKDYAFTETQDSHHYGMTCKCATQRCRSFLDFLQYKDPAYIQENYSNCSSFIQRKMSENGWLHDHVVRRIVFRPDGKSSLVYGLFALRPIPQGTNVVIMAGKIVTGKCLSKLDKRSQQMSLQIDNDKWQIPNQVLSYTTFPGNATDVQLYETGCYINHSCDPNCGMEDATRVVTIRDIGINEQITIDYAMVRNGTLVLEGDVFPCFCGSGSCRGTITPQDYTIIELKHFKYLSPFVQEMCVNDMTGGITRNLTTYSTSSSDSAKSTLSPNSLSSGSPHSASSCSDTVDGDGTGTHGYAFNAYYNEAVAIAKCDVTIGDESNTFKTYRSNAADDESDTSDTSAAINLHNQTYDSDTDTVVQQK